ncbi:DNA cytosine methyltransferase, partial [Enterococcus faecium]|uniref:DNA cytosine methyltransferase n=1 Tax=Enterococcus faecium TaxID=1352 RepID=UPI003F43A8B3
MTGKPIKARRGEYFRAWLGVLRQLGYEPEYRKLNAADYGEATTRSRFILMASKLNKQVAWPVATHSRNGEVDGTQCWRPAREI